MRVFFDGGVAEAPLAYFRPMRIQVPDAIDNSVGEVRLFLLFGIQRFSRGLGPQVRHLATRPVADQTGRCRIILL